MGGIGSSIGGVLMGPMSGGLSLLPGGMGGDLMSLPGNALTGLNSALTASGQSVPIVNPASYEQAQTAYGQSQDALKQQSAFLNALAAQNGVQNQSNVYNQLSGISNGTGPNPAQALLAQATANNTANQSALMAGQRGANQNVGLMARQAAQQGAANQQNSVGQMAALQAQQQLNAIGQMGNVAGQQVQNQGQNLLAYNNSVQNEQQNLLNSIAQSNNARVGMQSNVNKTNSDLAGQRVGLLGNMTGAAGSAAAAAAHGGVIHASYASGGSVANPATPSDGPRSNVGKFLSGQYNNADPTMMSAGGKVPAIVSPGEIYLDPMQAQAVAEGKANPRIGEKIPGQAKVKGDSYKNDTVSKTLDDGGVVIPRTKVNSGDAEQMAKFVAAALGKNKLYRK